jgi:hypothetical protein
MRQKISERVDILAHDNIDIRMMGQEDDNVERQDRIEDSREGSRDDDSSSSEGMKKDQSEDTPNRFGKGRGKSETNICPEGLKCPFGGWDKERNEPTVFLLNSKYK